MQKPRFVFFGTPHLAVFVLTALERAGLLPCLIVTAPDKPAGRGHKLTPSPVKVWAQEHGIDTLTPEKFDDATRARLEEARAEVFVVVAYGTLLPSSVLEIPPEGVLNVHPSLLPKLRGPSPIRTAILNDDKEAVGATVMLLDEKMDHGPVLAQQPYDPPEWPAHGSELDKALFTRGGELLAETLPRYLAGEIQPHEQDHYTATYSKKFTKEDGLLDLHDDPERNLRKVRAFEGWPGTFFVHNGERIKVTRAHIEQGEFVIDEVVPPGKPKMPYTDFQKLR